MSHARKPLMEPQKLLKPDQGIPAKVPGSNDLVTTPNHWKNWDIPKKELWSADLQPIFLVQSFYFNTWIKREKKKQQQQKKETKKAAIMAHEWSQGWGGSPGFAQRRASLPALLRGNVSTKWASQNKWFKNGSFGQLIIVPRMHNHILLPVSPQQSNV